MLKSRIEYNARKLRNNMTPAEVILWKMLKGKQLDNRKFRRQQIIGYYIIDFYCPSEHLAIELDGPIHNTTKAKQSDMKRDAYLIEHGIKVLRFKNGMVLKDPDTLLNKIRNSFDWKTKAQ
ncbi:MAG: DUF559 domain-containing protein [Candidatus Marinimicrobia bacterium]|nr:DUF559 domain-containing protein [Candidatus Neomarinimicrobiota bacterium]